MLLLDLPTELIVHILSYTSLADILSCQLTNKYLHSIITGSVMLQYKLERLATVAEDDPNSSLSISERLMALKRSEQAWATLEPEFSTSIPASHASSGIYDLTGGIYLLGNVDRRTLHYVKLPDSKKDEDKVTWKAIKVDRNIIDIGLCVYEHDLCAIVTTGPRLDVDDSTFDIVLHLLEFSTGKPHPKAKEHRIRVLNSRSEKPSLGIEIVGDNLVLILSFYRYPDHDDHVYVYNWRSSELKMHFTKAQGTYSGLIFLTEDIILLPNEQNNCLDIFRIPSKPVEFHNPILSLSLPSLTPGRTVHSIACRAEPNPIGRSAYEQNVRDEAYDYARRRGFVPSSEHAICFFIIRILIPQLFHASNSLALCVHRSSILAVVRNYEMENGEVLGKSGAGPANNSVEPEARSAQDNMSEPVKVQHAEESIEASAYATAPCPKIPWSEWGPPVSRWFNADDFPTRWITTTCGQRLVLTADNPDDSPFVVFDFNPQNVKKTKRWLWKLGKALKNVANVDVDEERESDNKEVGVVISDSLSQDNQDPIIDASGNEIGENSNLQGPLTSDDENLDNIIAAFEEQAFPAPMVEPFDRHSNVEVTNATTFEENLRTSFIDQVLQNPIFDSYLESDMVRNRGKAADRIWVISGSDAFDPGEMFSEKVEGCLPYVACATKEIFSYDGVLIDEERVLGLKIDVTERVERIHVHYFG